MQATRLPGKPLADIAGEPMIVHVWRRAMAAEMPAAWWWRPTRRRSWPPCARRGGEAVMTRADHASGSDRVFEAVNHVDPEGDFEIILNLQGDLPTLEPRLPRDCLRPAGRTRRPHIATLAAVITHAEEDAPIPTSSRWSARRRRQRRLRALYFTRATAPHGDGPLYHHIGIYAYRRSALERFVSLRPSTLEKREQLEQLRALEDGMRIDVTLVDTVPLEVNTPEDLERARRLLAGGGLD